MPAGVKYILKQVITLKHVEIMFLIVKDLTDISRQESIFSGSTGFRKAIPIKNCAGFGKTPTFVVYLFESSPNLVDESSPVAVPAKVPFFK